MSEIKLRWEVTKATEHDYWAYNNILRIYIRYNVQSQKMEWETCPINGGARAKNGKSDTMPEAISAAKKAASDLLLEDLEPSPAPVELEWVETKMSVYCAHCAHFNNLIEAYISTDKNGNVRFAPRVYVNGSGVSEMHIFDKHTLEEARAWCVAQIQKIITPKP